LSGDVEEGRVELNGEGVETGKKNARAIGNSIMDLISVVRGRCEFGVVEQAVPERKRERGVEGGGENVPKGDNGGGRKLLVLAKRGGTSFFLPQGEE